MCRSFYAALEAGAPKPEIASRWIEREVAVCMRDLHEEDECGAEIEYELYKRGKDLGTDAGWGRPAKGREG